MGKQSILNAFVITSGCSLGVACRFYGSRDYLKGTPGKEKALVVVIKQGLMVKVADEVTASSELPEGTGKAHIVTVADYLN